MADPIPKPASQRRRRNIDPSRQTIVGEPARMPVARPGWHADTLAAWVAWWASPMAGIWLDGDVPNLYLLADMFDDSFCGRGGAALRAEIRQLASEFGLTPLSRRRLQWEVSRAVVVDPVSGPDDGERWLRAVSD